MRPVPRELRRNLHCFPCLHTAAAPIRLLSECNLSVHHIATPAPIFTSFPLPQSCAVLLAPVVSSSMVVLTSDSLPGAGLIMPTVVWQSACYFLTTLHHGAPEEGFRCNSFRLLLHVSASPPANCCCLESKITSVGVSPDSLISAPRGVVGSALRMDLACRLRRSWKSSCLPTALGSHQSSLQYSATAWTHATWMAPMLSGTIPYVVVRVQSLAAAALACFMHQLCGSLIVGCASIQTPSQRVACVLNCMNPLLTVIFAVSCGQRCFLWPCLRVNSAASVLAVLNCSPRLHAHSMLLAAHFSSIETMWLT